MSEVRKLRVFKSHMAHMQYVFSGVRPGEVDAAGKPIPTGIGGKSAVFMSGEYRTDHPHEIAELEWEILNKHPFIHQDVDPTKRLMDAEDVDPMVALKKKHFAEFAEAQKVAMNATANVSHSNPQASGAGTGVATSASLGSDGAQQSDSLPGAAPISAGAAAFLAGFKKV